MLSSIFKHITGVDVFFVLSGFLITGILLNVTESRDKMGVLKKFYLRRFFRIFPIYYLSIIVLIIVNPLNYRGEAIFDILYVSNFKMGFSGEFSSVTPHFWSLAVEEQFYLFWPFFLLLVFPKKQYTFVKYSLLLGFLSYLVFNSIGYPFLGARTFNNLYYLAGGGLLAWLFLNRLPSYKEKIRKLSTIVLLLIISYGVFSFFIGVQEPKYVGSLISFLFSITIVQLFSCGFSGRLNSIVLFKPFLLLGKVSYGLYVYHMFMFIPYVLILKIFDLNLPENIYVSNVVKILLTVVVAIISWYLIERPILKVKERFQY